MFYWWMNDKCVAISLPCGSHGSGGFFLSLCYQCEYLSAYCLSWESLLYHENVIVNHDTEHIHFLWVEISAMPGSSAHSSAPLRLFTQLFFPPSVFIAFSHHMHTAGIDPQPTPSLLHSLLWSMTHKAHLTFTQLDASQHSAATHWLQEPNVSFFVAFDGSVGEKGSWLPVCVYMYALIYLKPQDQWEQRGKWLPDPWHWLWCISLSFLKCRKGLCFVFFSFKPAIHYRCVIY